jgi:hypothetical protein
VADERRSHLVTPGSLMPRLGPLGSGTPWPQVSNRCSVGSLSAPEKAFLPRHAGPVIGGLRVRGWVWLLSMLWVVLGAGGAIYATFAFSHPGYGEDLLIPKTIAWPGEPQMIIDVGVIAEVAWGLLSAPLLVAGFVRLRGWRPRRWLRVAGWAGSWVAGLALMSQAAEWAAAGEDGNRSVLSIGEMAICAAWLALGAAMTWILAGPAHGRDVPDTSSGQRGTLPAAA